MCDIRRHREYSGKCYQKLACFVAHAVHAAQILPTASDRKAVENILRTVTIEMGSRSGVSMAPLSRKTCEEYGSSATHCPQRAS